MNNYLFWKRFAQGKLKTHVSSVKIRIPSPKEILSWSERRLPNSTLVGKIDNAHTVEHDTLRPVSGGLFCERIFGPIATNVCACLRRKGWNEDYCKICEVQFTKSRLRRYQMGHILLAAPVIHIWALQGGYLANLLGKKNLGVRSIAYGKVMSQSKLWKPNNKGIRQIKYLTPNLEESLPLLSFRRTSGFTSVAKKSTICEKEKLGAKLPKAVLHSTTEGNSTVNTALGGRATRLATCLYDEGWSQIPAVTKAVRYQVGEALFSPKAAKQEATFGENKQHHKGKEKQSILKTKLFEKPFYFGDDNLLISFETEGKSYVNKETLPYKGKIKDQTRKAYERGNVLPFHQFVLYKPDTFNKITQFFNSLDKGQATTPNLERNFSFGEAFNRSVAAFVDTRPNFDVASDSTMKSRSESCPTTFTIENSSLSSLSEGKIEDLLEGKIVAKNQRFTEGNEIILPLPHYSKQKLVVLQNKTIRYTSSLGTLTPKFRPSTLDPCFVASPKEKSTICEKEKSSICKKEKLGDHSVEGSFARSYEGKTALPAEKLAKLPSAVGTIKSKNKSFLILQSPLDERSIQPNQKDTIRDFGIFSRSDTLYWGMFYDSYLESIFYVPSYKSSICLRGNVKDRPKAATHPLALLASHPEVRQNREIKSIPLDKLFNELIVQNRFNSVIDFGSYLRSTYNTLLLSSRPTFVASHAMIRKIKRTSRVKPFASQEVRPKGTLALQSTSFARRTNLIASNSFKVNNISRVKLAFASTPNFVKTDLSSRFRLSEGKIFDLKVNPEGKIKDLKVNPEKEIEDLLEARKLEINANNLTYSKIVKRTKPSLIDIKNIAYAGSSVLFQSLKNLNLVLLYSLINWKWEKSKIELDKFLLQNKLTKKKRNLRNKIAKTKIILTKRKNLVQSFLNTSQLPEWMIISILPVLPPALRPILELEPNNVVVSDLNVLYQTVIRRNDALMGLLSFRALEIDILNRQVSLQQAIEKLFDKGAGTKKRPVKSLSQGFHGKKGLFRSHLLGKRVDYSGRSVIVVGPQLKLHECGLPKEMALILFLPFLIARLKKRKVVANTSQAKQLILHKDKQIWNHLKSLIYEHPVLLNRAPTLHRLGFQAFQPILVSGKAMILPALVCTGFNADFDGDQMAVHIPLSHVARAESWKLLHAKNNMLSPATGKPIVVLSQEMILGCYCSSLILNFTHSYRKSSSPKEKSTICEKEKSTICEKEWLGDHNMKAWQKGAGLTNWRFKSKPRRKNLDFLGTLVKPEATIENKRYLETPISDLPKTLGRKITKKCFAASSSAYTEYNNLPNNRVATNLSKLNLVKLNLLSVAKPKLRKDLYFTTFQDIYKALGTNKIAIQTAVWLRIPFFEDNQFLEEPLEIRFDAMGHFFRSYCQSQRHFSKNIKSKDQLKGISYIRTSAGRIQLNETFYSSWS